MCEDRPRSAAVRIFDGMTRKTAPLPFAVHEDVGAETRQPRNLVREVGVVPTCELLPVLRRHDRLDQGESSWPRRAPARRVRAVWIEPSLRMSGGMPTHRCRSEAPCSHINLKRRSIADVIGLTFSTSATIWLELTMRVPPAVMTYQNCFDAADVVAEALLALRTVHEDRTVDDRAGRERDRHLAPLRNGVAGFEFFLGQHRPAV